MAYMFFRHQRPQVLSFDDHLSKARAAGFNIQPGSGGTRIERAGVACIVREGQGGIPMTVESPGIVMGNEIGGLTDGGFQKFFRTPHGRIKPALAEELVAVQNFSEDLREAFGLTCLYNESLGTVSTQYVYDRVKGRDSGTTPKPWETTA
jgi:hypothetical protein